MVDDYSISFYTNDSWSEGISQLTPIGSFSIQLAPVEKDEETVKSVKTSTTRKSDPKEQASVSSTASPKEGEAGKLSRLLDRVQGLIDTLDSFQVADTRDDANHQEERCDEDYFAEMVTYCKHAR